MLAGGSPVALIPSAPKPVFPFGNASATKKAIKNNTSLASIAHIDIHKNKLALSVIINFMPVIKKTIAAMPKLHANIVLQQLTVFLALSIPNHHLSTTIIDLHIPEKTIPLQLYQKISFKSVLCVCQQKKCSRLAKPPASFRCPDLYCVSALAPLPHFHTNQAWESSIPSYSRYEMKNRLMAVFLSWWR